MFHKEIRTVNRKPNPYHTPLEHTKVVPAIMCSFKSFHDWLIEDVIVKAIIPMDDGKFDFSDQRSIAKLLCYVPRNYRPFMSEFMRTQQFHMYSEKILEYSRRKTANYFPQLRQRAQSFTNVLFPNPSSLRTSDAAVPIPILKKSELDHKKSHSLSASPQL
jgi:hypothetical protein